MARSWTILARMTVKRLLCINDGVDYVVMPQWKLSLVQLLNIAGLAPSFACHGAQGPPWCSSGSPFGKSLFLCQVWRLLLRMMRSATDGASIAEITGRQILRAP